MNACSRFHAATLELVKSAPMKQRLAAAFSNHLKGMDPAELPTDLRETFVELAEGLEAVPPLRGETAVQATVRKMSPDQADAFAARIVELYGDLQRVPSSVTRLPVRERRDEPSSRESASEVVPLLFAAEA